MKNRAIFLSVIILLLLVVSLSIFQIIRTSLDYKRADDIYEELQNKYVDTIPQQSEETEPEKVDQAVTAPSTTEISPEGSLREPTKISVDFETLLADNKEIVGWLYCPDTPINYPVVQAKDNNKYLRADLNGKYLVSGTLFVDYRNGVIGEDRNYVIYGHNMKNGTMFGSLLKYKDQGYYDSHSTMLYLTPEGEYTVELVAGFVVSSTDMIYQTNPDTEEYRDYLDTSMGKSTFRSNVTLSDEDRLVVLSTCSYEFDSARYVLIGKIVL